ncbi:MAG TPA: hypothetical protein VGM78_11215, partial [Ilumatobacteraceae bacterium]
MLVGDQRIARSGLNANSAGPRRDAQAQRLGSAHRPQPTAPTSAPDLLRDAVVLNRSADRQWPSSELDDRGTEEDEQRRQP